jgi:hypothetical protein
MKKVIGKRIRGFHPECFERNHVYAMQVLVAGVVYEVTGKFKAVIRRDGITLMQFKSILQANTYLNYQPLQIQEVQELAKP